MKNLLLFAIASLTLTTACKKDDTAAPATMQISGSLNAANEVVDKGSPTIASNGVGTLTGTYDPTSKVVNYTVTFSGLTSEASGSHFHFGDAKHKTLAPTVVLTNPPKAVSGTFSGSATLTAMQADSLTSGKFYINIHTNNNPTTGEIRSTVVAK